MGQIKVSDIRKELTVNELFGFSENIEDLVSSKGTTYQASVIKHLPVVVAGDITEKLNEDGSKSFSYLVFEPKTKFSFSIKAPNLLSVHFGDKIVFRGVTGGVVNNKTVWFKATKVGLYNAVQKG